MNLITLFIAFASVVSAQLLPLSEIAIISIPRNQSAPIGKGATSQSSSYDSRAVAATTYNSVLFNGTVTKFERHLSDKWLSKRHKDGDCSPQPLGAGHVPSPDTPKAFLADSGFSTTALGAATPSGWVNTFQNLKGSTQVPMGYLGYTSLLSYDTNQCAALCDSTEGCFAFNIYFERDPTVDPGDQCRNPPSTTVIKCVYWGTYIESVTATNNGQSCADFHMVIAGSNGYIKRRNFPQTGYTGTPIGKVAINAPPTCNSFIGYMLFDRGSPFDPARCAASCEAETAHNVQYMNSRAICRFFNTYILEKNGIPQAQICAMYTRSWNNSFATMSSQSFGSDTYTIAESYTYSNITDPGATICDATCMSQSVCGGGSSSSSSTTTYTTSIPTSSSKAATTTSTMPVIATTPFTSTRPGTTLSTITTTGSSIATTSTTTTSTTSTATPNNQLSWTPWSDWKGVNSGAREWGDW